MKAILFGPPGSGKGTYGSRVSEQLSIPLISTGQLLREEIEKQTEMGKRAKTYVDTADWDAQEIHEIVMALVEKRISQPDAQNGFIFDGFPRTMKQAQDLENIIKVDIAINIKVPEEIIIRRLTSRRTCKECGGIYNILSLKPKQEGICDKCGGELYQRADETAEMTKKRLAEHEELVGPIMKYYEEKGLLKDVGWDEKNIPEGGLDIPPEIMVNKIIGILKEYQK